MDNTKHKVTKHWLEQHKTTKGAWTKAQILALGIEYPPKSGWQRSVIGEFITMDQARRFEEGKAKYAPIKTMKLKKIKASLKTLERVQLVEIGEYIKQLLVKK